MSIILNKEELETNELRRQALDILEAGYEAIDTEKVLRKKVSVESGMLCVEDENKKMTCMTELREGVGRVFFVGIGKCALDGARVIEDILGDHLEDGIALDVKQGDLKKIRSFAGTHPYPSEQNVMATKEILNMVENLNEDDLVITLISGGGSALFELPISEVDLDTIIQTTKELTAKGADIYELNKARKGLSQVKGGKFAEFILPARVVSLIFSDVLGNDISVVASGPTVLNQSTEKVKNILVLSNRDALEAMKSKAEEFGFAATIETETLSGNAVEIGKKLVLREPKSKTCVLFGGETTVILPAFAPGSELRRGEGGRNQTMALSSLSYIKPDMVMICAASDGWDNTDHAGAIADAELFEKAKHLNLLAEEFLDKSDSYNFFKLVGGAIYTGRLGSNVSDLCIMLYK